MATGGTIGRDLIKWLNEKDNTGEVNSVKILDGRFKLSIHLFCLHTWGKSFQECRLKKTFSDKIGSKITWYNNATIENHVKWNNQSLNIAIPNADQPPNVITYLTNLSAKKYEDYAFRKEGKPASETFFTSPKNRIRYENILLQKGLSIINMIQGQVKPNIRPLGLINPNYKTFGLGTHFFTWRNIPNNSPLVFWWEVPNYHWQPLFQVANNVMLQSGCNHLKVEKGYILHSNS